MDIFEWFDCTDCPCYRFHKGRTAGDPDRCYPDEAACADGDFGNEYPCSRMLSRIEEGLRNTDFGFPLSYLVEGRRLTEKEYWDVLEAWPDVEWTTHPYWQVFYDETVPVGFDSVEEVYEEVFR
jgi:hypothetical protein